MRNLTNYGWQVVLTLMFQLMTSMFSAPAAASEAIGLERFIFEQIHRALKGRARSQADVMSQAVIRESQLRRLDPLVVLSVIATESRFRTTVVGRHGEVGLMQLKPDTAQWIAHRSGLPWRGSASLKNPEVNIELGAAYLAFLSTKFQARRSLYLTAYNMGAAKLRLLLSRAQTPQVYATKVLQNYVQFQSKQSRSVASR